MRRKVWQHLTQKSDAKTQTTPLPALPRHAQHQNSTQIKPKKAKQIVKHVGDAKHMVKRNRRPP